MRRLSSREAVENAIRVLLNSGKSAESKKWQAIARQEGEFKMIEVCDLFFKMGMVEDPNRLAELVEADLPWAENHFQERLKGPSNPGHEYKNWPYWVVNPEFMEGDLFSHTYQERFWPGQGSAGNHRGIRYEAGTWYDIKERMEDDLSTRQAFLSIWHPEDQSNNGVRVPCTIGYWFKINHGSLDVTYLIRSCDARRHLRNDIYMTQRLAHEMLEHLRKYADSELSLGTMNMWIGSLHCFESDIYELKKQLR